MENTRVFVSGLPPTCSNDQLRNHFAARFTVTDAHVLPKRRMGFVGFKSNEVAQEAVNYFNRTYMKMSRISVDLARPVRDASRQLAASICFSFCLRSPLTSSVFLETDPYHRRLILSPQRELILHGSVMLQRTHLRTTLSSVKEMPTPSRKTPSCRSTLL
jgi:RNA recognition motif-containing protein